MKKTSPLPSIIGCLVIQLCVGILYLWSVFRKDFPAVYALAGDSTIPGMITSYMLFSFVIGNFIGGFVNDKKGPKFTAVIGVVMFAAGVGATGLLNRDSVGLIVLTYCVIGGLGSGIAYGACISCVQKWLPHRRGLASGLAVSAFGFSTVVFAPVANRLIDAFRDAGSGIANFSPVFFILAGVFFALGIAACFFVRLPDKKYLGSLPKPASNAKIVSSTRDYTLAQAAGTAPFWLIFLYIFFINGTWNLTSPLIATLGENERGLSNALAVFAVSFTGVTNSAGRLIMAAVSDRIGRVAASLILCGVTLVGAIFMTFIAGIPYIVTVAVIAFAYGGPSAINAAVSTDFFGPKNSGTNYGVVMMGLGVSSVFFNMISNTVLKRNPIPTFIMGGVTAVLAAVCMLVISRYLAKIKRGEKL
ncbi:MAG: MFS transporter [Oscillospiraceae bacterium]|jgi:OFA family oxalate/formate antiporter-like MFS transporter|nr:MFS transporter [Oscillospiraceae bacterium]